MEQIYFLSNISKLRQLGTTNFFRTIYNTDSIGVVSCMRAKPTMCDIRLDNHELKFTKLPDGEYGDDVPTITELLNVLKVRDMLENPSLIKHVLDSCNGIIRAELEVTDYRVNTTSKYFRVEYVLDMVIPKNKAVVYDENTCTEQQLMAKYKELSSNTFVPYQPTEITIPKFQVVSRPTRGIVGF